MRPVTSLVEFRAAREAKREATASDFEALAGIIEAAKDGCRRLGVTDEVVESMRDTLEELEHIVRSHAYSAGGWR